MFCRAVPCSFKTVLLLTVQSSSVQLAAEIHTYYQDVRAVSGDSQTSFAGTWRVPCTGACQVHWLTRGLHASCPAGFLVESASQWEGLWPDLEIHVLVAMIPTLSFFAPSPSWWHPADRAMLIPSVFCINQDRSGPPGHHATRMGRPGALVLLREKLQT